jgi:PAS domain S-box-containing protein
MASLWAAGGRADEAGDMAPLRLTFVESLDIAFENSQWRSVSRLEVEIAAAQHRQALSTYWPQVVGRSVLTRRDDDPIFIFPEETDNYLIPLGDQLVNLLGYQLQEFTEMPEFWTKCIHMEDLPRVLGSISNVLGRGYYTHQYRMEDGEGHYRWIQDEMSLVRDDEGQPLEIVGAFIDITDRLQAQEARRQVELELESQRALSTRKIWMRSSNPFLLPRPMIAIEGRAWGCP